MKKIMFGAMVLIGLSISASALLMDSKLDGIEVIPNNECKEGYVLVNTRDTVSKAVCYNSCEDLGIRVVALENAIDCSGEDLSGEVTTEGNESTRLAADNTCEGGFNNEGLQDPELTVGCSDINTTALSEGYLDLTEIKGALVFDGGSYSDISNLKNLTEADVGLAFVNNKNLVSLAGLENLENAGILLLYSNQLTNLDTLSNLEKVTSLNVSANNLTNIDGLSNITEAESLFFGTNQLTNIDGLSNLTTVTDYLSFASNNLTNVDALSNLQTVGSLSLTSNNLTNVNGLSNLKKATGDIRLKNNSDLSNISGLSNLTYTERLYLGNTNIKDLSPLNNLTVGISIYLDDKDYDVKLSKDSYLCNEGFSKITNGESFKKFDISDKSKFCY